MTRTTWLLTALGIAGAFWDAAAAAPRRPATNSDASVTRRASDFFSRNGQTTTGSAPEASGAGAASLSGKTSVKGESASGFDPRLRPKSVPTTASSDEPEAEEVVFGASNDEPAETVEPETVEAMPNRLRIRPKTAGVVTPVAANRAAAESDEFGAGRTPSGDPLRRGLSEEEEASGVVHAAGEDALDQLSGKIRAVRAEASPEENPFMPVEEFLKHKPRKTAPTMPVSVSRPRSQPAVPEAAAKAAEKPKAEDAPVARETQPGTRTPGGRGNVTETQAIKPNPRPNAAVSYQSEGTVAPAVSTAAVSPDSDETPRVTVRWARRTEINVGQPAECELVVKNHGGVPANDIVVEAYFPKSVRLTSSSPEPSEVADFLTWKFPAIGPGEEKSIRVSLIPSQKGDLNTTAHVRYTGMASSVFQVNEPLLAVEVKGPREVLVGDPASHIIVITNPGTGMASNVVVEALIPKGLEHARGEKLVMEIGALGPNESRTVRLALSAVAGGEHTVQVMARAEAGLAETAETSVVVIAPSIQLAMEGPSLRYLGRTATYSLTVGNDGAAPSNNVRVMHKVPEGFRFVRADKGGKYDESSRTVSWFVGRLEPGQKAVVKAELGPTKTGSYKHLAGAVSEQGARADAHCETAVDGTAAVQMEVVELADPVEVGAEAVYEIRLRNSGSKAATNVGISCETANVIELVSATGPTEFLAENGLVVFKSLPSLPAGSSVAYRVTVKSTQEGNHRFRVRLASDSITEPLISEELTKFYAE